MNFSDESMVNLCIMVGLEVISEVSSIFDLKAKSATTAEAKWALEIEIISGVDGSSMLCAWPFLVGGLEGEISTDATDGVLDHFWLIPMFF